MSPSAIEGAVLDHVAHAVPRWQDVWGRYAGDFGAEWSSGGPGAGFAPAQLRFGNGARVEVLMPNDVASNDFLARFLAHSGPGPHHLTFKVPDLNAALDQVRQHGFEPIGVNRNDPEWMEAFIHPKQATGVVVQIAEAPAPWTNPPPEDYPTRRRQRADGSGPLPPADLVQVTHGVSDLGAAHALFIGLLGGRVVNEGSSNGVRWSELTWPGALGVRLVAPTVSSATGPLSEWLAGRTGRVHHLELAVEEPADIVGARPTDPIGIDAAARARPEGSWEISPSLNGGLRLVIHGPD